MIVHLIPCQQNKTTNNRMMCTEFGCKEFSSGFFFQLFRKALHACAIHSLEKLRNELELLQRKSISSKLAYNQNLSCSSFSCAMLLNLLCHVLLAVADSVHAKYLLIFRHFFIRSLTHIHINDYLKIKAKIADRYDSNRRKKNDSFAMKINKH